MSTSSEQFIDHDGLFPPEMMKKIRGYNANLVLARARGKNYDAIAETLDAEREFCWLLEHPTDQIPEEAVELLGHLKEVRSEFGAIMG